MAYDDSGYRGDSAFRSEPGYRDDDGDFDDTRADRAGPALTDAQLSDVFDDPEHGEPGRDRMGVHAVWELTLLLAAGGVGYLLYRADRDAISGDQLRDLMLSATVLGLLVLGTGLSLRAAVPNLAVGAIAWAAAMFFADRADNGILVTAAQACLLAMALGLVIGLVTVGLHVPAWAVSLAAGLGLLVWIQARPRTYELATGAYDPTDQAAYLLVIVGAAALLGGLAGSAKSIRRALGRFRPVADPARRRGGAAAAVSVLALVGSSAFAGAAGVILALQDRQVAPPDRSLALTGLALGGALLAGTSAFGRRGGVFGTILAAVLLALTVRYLDVTDRRVAPLAVGAVAIGIGLVVTRLVEARGRPRSSLTGQPDAWQTVSPAGETGRYASVGDADWSASDRPSGWTSPLPASSADDRWGTENSWRDR